MNLLAMFNFSRRSEILTFVILATINFYFFWSQNYGLRGTAAYENASAELSQATQHYESLKAAAEKLERRVAKLRPETLDKDLLTEMAYAQLALVGPNAIIVKFEKR